MYILTQLMHHPLLSQLTPLYGHILTTLYMIYLFTDERTKKAEASVDLWSYLGGLYTKTEGLRSAICSQYCYKLGEEGLG